MFNVAAMEQSFSLGLQNFKVPAAYEEAEAVRWLDLKVRAR